MGAVEAVRCDSGWMRWAVTMAGIGSDDYAGEQSGGMIHGKPARSDRKSVV